MNNTITIHPNKRHLTLENLYHFCIALLPFIYIFKFPVVNMSVGTVVLLATVPYAFLYLISGLREIRNSALLVFSFFYIYLMLRCEGNLTRMVFFFATFINIGGMINGSVKSKKLRRIIETFAIINVGLLLIQLVFFYVLHTRLQYVPRGLVYPEYQESYVFRPLEGMYRPSALFLEPSHFTQFCIYALISALFPGKDEKMKPWKVIAIASGCILTTSGMGIALTAGVLGWWLLFSKDRKEQKVIRIFALIPIMLFALMILMQTTFFQTAMQRVFSKVDGYNAVSGRMHNWDDAIGTMDTFSLWFGYGDSAQFPLYLAGLADTIYKYGVFCVILEAGCFLYLCLIKRKNYVLCGTVVFIIMFIVAHNTNYVAHLFYFGLLIAEAVSYEKVTKKATVGIMQPVEHPNTENGELAT